MKHKKWWAAIGIVGALTVAFFWGGERQPSSYMTNEIISKYNETVENHSDDNSASQQQPNFSSPLSSAVISDDNSQSASLSNANPNAMSSTGKQNADEDDQGNEPEPKAARTQVQPPAETVDDEIKEKAPEASPSMATDDDTTTESISEDRPKPVEWQDVTIDNEQERTATLSVSAATIWSNLDIFNEDKLEVLPEDGTIFPPQQVIFYDGESVFDVLLREMSNHKIHLEFEMTPIYNSHYIEGIHNLYEFDCGELSGWMYKVNGWFPNYGASRYVLEDGDVVEWVYTCDLGRDVGGYVEGVETGAVPTS